MIECRGPFRGQLSSAYFAAGLAAIGLAANAAAEPPSGANKPNPNQIAGLIRDLGSDRFAAREAASDRLARMGLPAFAALEEATRHSDREIRYRAERILAVIRKNDLERRLAAFVAGTGEDDYQLPSWKRYSQGYGDTEASRKLFVEMQRAEPELLAALERDARAGIEVLGRRLAERAPFQIRAANAAPAPLSDGEFAAFLFVAAEEDVKLSTTATQMLYTAVYQPLRALNRPADNAELIKKMVGSVVRRCDIEVALPWLGLARELELKEALVPALKVLEQHEKFNRQTIMAVAVAASCVADMGDESHIPELEKLLASQIVVSQSSSSVLINGQRTIRQREMQVRDVALAALVTLTKQDAKEYFGAEIPPRTRSAYSVFPAMTIGFEVGEEGEKRRAAAQQKWAEYKQRQAKPAERAAGEGSP